MLSNTFGLTRLVMACVGGKASGMESCLVVSLVGMTVVGLPQESMHREANAADRLKSRIVHETYIL